jgi:hypothetical protein
MRAHALGMAAAGQIWFGCGKEARELRRQQLKLLGLGDGEAVVLDGDPLVAAELVEKPGDGCE